MNRLIRGSLVLVILAGMVLVAGSTARADVPDEWKSLDVVGLTALAKQFVAKGDAGVDDCKALAEYVGQQYATSLAGGQVDWNEWLGLAEVMWRYLPETAKTVMAKDIQLKLSSNNEAIGNLSLEKMVALIKILGDKATPSICTTWFSLSNKYKFASPTQTYYLAQALASAGKAGISARQEIADHIKATYLKDKATVQSVRCWYWR